MAQLILEGAFFLFIPALLIWAEKHSTILKSIGTVVLCYILGAILANTHVYSFSAAITKNFSELPIPLAIPLLLFSVDFNLWKKMAKPTMIALAVSIFSIIFSVLVLTPFFSDSIENIWKLSGMLVGVYTGGTPNLTSIALGLDVNEETILLVNTVDLIIGGTYFFIVLSFIHRILIKFLPKFSGEKNTVTDCDLALKKVGGNDFIASCLSAIFVFGSGAGLSLILLGKLSGLFIIIFVTTAGLLLSFIKPIRELRSSYSIGQYLLYIFCLAIGSMADLSQVSGLTGSIFVFILFVVVLTIIVNFLLAYIFKIDADTALITHIAALYGPPFVGPVANTINNKTIVASGMAAGVFGLAIGNYIGIGVAYLVKLLYT